MIAIVAETEAFSVLGHMWLISPLLFDSYLVGAVVDILSHDNHMIHVLII